MRTHSKFIFLILFYILGSSCSSKIIFAKARPSISISKYKDNENATIYISSQRVPKKKKISSSKVNFLSEKIILRAKKYLGTPYKHKGSKRGIDCSRLMVLAFSPYKIKIPHSALAQSKKGKLISKNQIKKGDLLFFATGKGKKVTHVALVNNVEGNKISFIHAATSKGVSISNLSKPYWARRFLFAKRLF